MAAYRCVYCGRIDFTGWTDYYLRGGPPICAVCEPRQRCHWHNEVARRAQDEAGLGEVDADLE